MSPIALLTLFGRIPPEALDAIIGQGPLSRSRGDLVSLNPQPLPPRDPFFVGAAAMAQQVVGIAVEADVRDELPVDLVGQLVADWCETPWPRKWPWPGPGPRPDEGPHPEPWRVDVGRVIGAVVFASAASRLAEGKLRTALVEGAERLAEVAAPD